MLIGENHSNVPNAGQTPGSPGQHADSYARRSLHRIAESTGRDGGEGDRRDAVPLGKIERVHIAPPQQLGFGFVYPIDWTQTMDHVMVRKPVRTRDNRLPRLDGGQRPAFFFELRPGRPVDGACHTTADSSSALAALTTASTSG